MVLKIRLLFVLFTLVIPHVMLYRVKKLSPINIKYYCVQVLRHNGSVGKSLPILLIHGFGTSYKEWDGLYQVLATQTGRRIYLVQLRNHGDSPWITRTDTPSILADIVHLVKKLKLKSIDVIGHSLGGKLAVAFALNFPHLVNSVIVEDMRPNGLPDKGYSVTLKKWQIYKRCMSSVPKGLDKSEAIQYIVGYINNEYKKSDSGETMDAADIEKMGLCFMDGEWQFKFNLDVLKRAFENFPSFWKNTTGLYEGPALFIYGTESPFTVMDIKDDILQLFPKAKLFPVEGAGHEIHGPFPIFTQETLKLLNEAN